MCVDIELYELYPTRTTVLDSNPLLVISLENIFSQSVGYLFILVDPVVMITVFLMITPIYSLL